MAIASGVLLSGAEIDKNLARGCHKCGNTKEFTQETAERTTFTLVKCGTRYEAGDRDTWADYDIDIACQKCGACVWNDGEWLNVEKREE